MRSVRLFATATVAMFILIRFLNLAMGGAEPPEWRFLMWGYIIVTVVVWRVKK